MKAKEFLSAKGYSSVTNYTTNTVAGLMQEYADQQNALLLKRIKELEKNVSDAEWRACGGMQGYT